MRKSMSQLLVAPMLIASAMVLVACVTINVYFPAAEAQAAAAEFVDKVIGDQAAPATNPPPKPEEKKQPSAYQGPRFDPMSLFINSAQAAEGVDITIRTPAIQAIQDRMAERFQSSLEAQFSSGALGFGKDGLIVVRDASKIALKDRVSVNQFVADDNRDRNAVYREIAVANGHAEWEGQIRQTFAKQWVASARAGWWYQAADGSWKQK
ncbi:MAG TPA: YdbL family protein [Arenimonas sp.]|uniref:YdbL family protein n=1 Tax=Arenimonas sp. TaxID=1872635 RepID=UPI002D15DE78|nr:YdbL family protein [Arenimonas sp.]HMB57927.1 YdbL family protein [Arenimonas sp.]